MSYIDRLAYDAEARAELQRLLDDLAHAYRNGESTDVYGAVWGLVAWTAEQRSEAAAAPRAAVAL